MGFAGKKALIIGGTSGIGLATAVKLKAEGADVHVMGRSAENLANAQNAGVEAHALDVLDRDAMAAVFAELAPFDLMINAATGGARAGGPFLQMDLDAYQGSFRKLWATPIPCRLLPRISLTTAPSFSSAERLRGSHATAQLRCRASAAPSRRSSKRLHRNLLRVASTWFRRASSIHRCFPSKGCAPEDAYTGDARVPRATRRHRRRGR